MQGEYEKVIELATASIGTHGGTFGFAETEFGLMPYAGLCND
jgi:hypothetical protein